MSTIRPYGSQRPSANTLPHDVAHPGHTELLTPEPERSLWFFTEILGMTACGQDGDSVHLCTYDDYE